MTRDTVTVGEKTAADVFHNHDEDHPHCVIQIGDSEIVLDGEDDYVDVEINGWKRGDAVDLTPEDQGYHRVFRVREEGTLVATGVTYATSAVPVEIVIGGTNHIVVPNNQRVTIDLYGEPVDDEMRTDGGSTCAECGAELPEEIDPGTGVYCSNCGHGQLVTDGGAVRPTFDTPLTYQARCGARDCGSLVGMSDTYCSHCGTKIDWPAPGDEPVTGDEVPRKLLTGGSR